MRSRTPRKSPRRICSFVRWANQTSTRLSHDARVGMQLEVEARMPLQPPLNRGMRMRGVGVDDGMHVDVGRRVGVEHVEKVPTLLLSLAGVAGADHRAVEDIQRREQGGRAMSLVVVGHRPGSARLQRPPRLRSLQGVNLALLINTNHEGLVRRIHVQPHDIGQLLDERGIGRQRAGADTMRLQAMRDPDPMDRRGTQALGGGPRPQTPLRRAWRRPVQRCLDDRLFASGGHLPFPTSSRRIAPPRVGTPRRAAPPPQADGILARIELPRDVRTWHPTRGQQDDATAKDPPLRGGAGAHPARQCGTLLVGQRQCGHSIHGPQGTKPSAYVQVVSRSLHYSAFHDCVALP